MSKILAILNIKGGVGKTTSTVNLAAALTERGRKVLAIDLDPQASLTFSLGFNPETLGQTLADVIAGRCAEFASVIISTPERFDIAPSSHQLLQETLGLTNDATRLLILKESLESVQARYDYLLIDCPANAGFLTQVALVTAKEVLIPFTPDYLSYKSLEWLVSIIRKTQFESNPNLRIAGIFYSMLDLRTRHARAVVKLVEKSFGSAVPVLTTTIRESVRLKEATMAGKTIFQYAPDSSSAESYRALARELDQGIKKTTPDELQIVLAQGHQALEQNNLADAYNAFCHAIEIDPRLPDAWIGSAQSTPQWSESIKCYARALELGAREQPIHEEIERLVKNKIAFAKNADAAELVLGAKSLIQIEEMELAEPLLKRATELDPNNDTAWLLYALASKNAQNNATYLNQCLEINPNNKEAQMLLATMKQNLATEIEQLIEQAEALLKDGHRAEAHAKYLQATEIAPTNDVAWFGAARTAKRFLDRLEYAENALKVNPRNNEAREFCGVLHSFLVAQDETIEPPRDDLARWRWLIPVGIILLAIAVAFIVDGTKIDGWFDTISKKILDALPKSGIIGPE